MWSNLILFDPNLINWKIWKYHQVIEILIENYPALIHIFAQIMREKAIVTKFLKSLTSSGKERNFVSHKF